MSKSARFAAVAIVALCLATSTWALAPAPPSPVAAGVTAGAVPPASARGSLLAGSRGSLADALDAIRPEQIRADLEFLASDEFAGRDTPSREQRIAARFLRNRLQRLGFQPGAKDGWFQTYPINFRRLKEPETRAWLEAGGQKRELAFFRDWFIGQRDLDPHELKGPLVWVGHATKEELSQTLAVRGKVALVVDRGDFGEQAAELLAAAGAIGMVLARPEAGRAPAFEEYFPPLLEGMRRGNASWPRGGDQPKRLPRAYLSRSATAALFELAGTTEPRIGQDLGVTFASTVALHGDGKTLCENVCGYWPGIDPERAREVIIVSAHYDHIGVADDGKVFNGADDNGSGTTGMLALAEALTVLGPLERSVMLIWVSGEEKGLWGSQAWSDAPWLPEGGRAVADINIDMIGRNEPNKLGVTPTAKHKEYNGLTRLAERLASSEGFGALANADQYYTRSDHANFRRLGIPVAFLFADIHADYHQVTDDVEKIDFDKIARVTRLVLRMLDEMQSSELLPAN